jgi:hypothetical protein
MDIIWNGAFLVPFLALGTLLGVLVLAMRSQEEVLKRMRDPNAPKSSLAADAPANSKADETVD